MPPGTKPEMSIFMYVDVLKFGSRYGAVDTRDNSPVGPTFPTRDQAWDFVADLDAKGVAALGQGIGRDTIEKWLEDLKPDFADVFGGDDLNKPKVSPPKVAARPMFRPS